MWSFFSENDTVHLSDEDLEAQLPNTVNVGTFARLHNFEVIFEAFPPGVGSAGAQIGSAPSVFARGIIS